MLMTTLPATTPLSDTEKDDFLASLRIVTFRALGDLQDVLHGSRDPEQLRKMVAFGVDALGWKVDNKKDATDNLPVFNFIINGGAVSVESVKPQITIDSQTCDLPTLSMDQLMAINADLDLEEPDA